MKIKPQKVYLKYCYAFLFFIPILLTILYFVQWHKENGQAIIISIILITWILAIVLSVIATIKFTKDPYPFHYLVDYDTLINYLKDEEIFSFENKLEASFHLYLYQEKQRHEIQSWHHNFSTFEDEKTKGHIIYYNGEEISNLDEFIANKLPRYEGYLLIELIDCDSVKLNEYKANHPELDVVAYIENYNKNI